MNVFDYLDWRGDLPMDVVAFNELDGVILARFSYLPFERLPESFFDQPVTVTQTAQALLEDPELDLFLRNKTTTKVVKTTHPAEYNNGAFPSPGTSPIP